MTKKIHCKIHKSPIVTLNCGDYWLKPPTSRLFMCKEFVRDIIGHANVPSRIRILASVNKIPRKKCVQVVLVRDQDWGFGYKNPSAEDPDFVGHIYSSLSLHIRKVFPIMKQGGELKVWVAIEAVKPTA